MVKNPNWPEANQLAIYKRGQGVEGGSTTKQVHQRLERNLDMEPPDFKSST